MLNNKHEAAKLVKRVNVCDDDSRIAVRRAATRRWREMVDLIPEPDVPEPGDQPERPPSRRERARAATIEEIKQTAMGLMREQGTTDFRFSDIARLMGMTAP